ncbi:MAG: hypothetical protein ACPG8W_10105 [Candidatus Promineifilaceae bacterium]
MLIKWPEKLPANIRPIVDFPTPIGANQNEDGVQCSLLNTIQKYFQDNP